MKARANVWMIQMESHFQSSGTVLENLDKRCLLFRQVTATCYDMSNLLPTCYDMSTLSPTCYYMSTLSPTCYYMSTLSPTCYDMSNISPTCYCMSTLSTKCYDMSTSSYTCYGMSTLSPTCYGMPIELCEFNRYEYVLQGLFIARSINHMVTSIMNMHMYENRAMTKSLVIQLCGLIELLKVNLTLKNILQVISILIKSTAERNGSPFMIYFDK